MVSDGALDETGDELFWDINQISLQSIVTVLVYGTSVLFISDICFLIIQGN